MEWKSLAHTSRMVWKSRNNLNHGIAEVDGSISIGSTIPERNHRGLALSQHWDFHLHVFFIVDAFDAEAKETEEISLVAIKVCIFG